MATRIFFDETIRDRGDKGKELNLAAPSCRRKTRHHHKAPAAMSSLRAFAIQ
jgi:hypothetical protein